jgi:hypothetical protein
MARRVRKTREKQTDRCDHRWNVDGELQITVIEKDVSLFVELVDECDDQRTISR